MIARKRELSSTHQGSDAAVLACVAQGDLASLGVLYDRHHLPLLHFVQRVTRGGSDAEDVVQETFLTAARVASKFDGRQSCRPWLFGIAARIVLHRGRTAARLGRLLGRLFQEPTEGSPAPDDILARREFGDELRAALARLSDEKRVAIVMADVEGMSCQEIATALDVPIGTIWRRLHRARRELFERLSGRTR